ncbi:unnamed protein product [Oreochromis niloticus]|nr:unnamed protein product [Mustela putorius furo]
MGNNTGKSDSVPVTEDPVTMPALISEPKENGMPLTSANMTNTGEIHNYTCNCCCWFGRRKNTSNHKKRKTHEPGTPIENEEKKECCLKKICKNIALCCMETSNTVDSDMEDPFSVPAVISEPKNERSEDFICNCNICCCICSCECFSNWKLCSNWKCCISRETDEPGNPIENKERKKEKYRLLLQICMAKLVKQVVKKSGKVISCEEVEAIYKRLTNKIWAEIKDQVDEISLHNFKILHKMIFKTLSKKWESTEIVLLFMQLNLSGVNNIIVKTFIEESAKLSKRSSRKRQFFSSVGRLFCPCLCCMQNSNIVDSDMVETISVSAVISEPKENAMPLTSVNVTNTEEEIHNHTCNCCIDRKNILIQNHKKTQTDEPRSPTDKKENRNEYRSLLEMCMEELVKQVVKKSGKVISWGEVEAIYKRLTNKIWAEIDDKFDEILLMKPYKLYKRIFKALCKKWNSAERVLQMMELNLPLNDNIIAVTFIEEAVKLPKKPSRIRRFFSSVGRLFRRTSR